MNKLVALMLIAGMLAGCTEGPDEPAAAGTDDPDVVIDADRPVESFGEVVTGPAVGPDLNATTAAAPNLVMGEWWRVRFNAYLGQGDVEVVRVVADVNDEGYIMGMPHEGWLKEAISFHSPAFGDINKDLSYNTHNMRFEPVRFPLTTGATWETHFAAAPYTATVEMADDTTATILFEPIPQESAQNTIMGALGLVGDGGGMRLTYDATMHEVIRMESSIGVWEVLEHGYDFEGWVTVPRGEDTAIDYGTFGPAGETYTPAERTIDVAGGFNRMTMMHFIGTVDDVPAVVKARDVTPDGTEFITEMQGAGFRISFFETAAVDGTWTVEDINGGASFTYHMGIAYHQFDIKLPGGERRSDHSHEVVR